MFATEDTSAVLTTLLVEKSFDCEAAYDQVEALLKRIDELETENELLYNILEKQSDSYEEELEEAAKVECMFADTMLDLFKFITNHSERTTPPGFVYAVKDIIGETLKLAGYEVEDLI